MEPAVAIANVGGAKLRRRARDLLFAPFVSLPFDDAAAQHHLEKSKKIRNCAPKSTPPLNKWARSDGMSLPDATRQQVRQRAGLAYEFCGVTEARTNSDLTGTNWLPSVYSISTTGGLNSISVQVLTSSLFFRLQDP